VSEKIFSVRYSYTRTATLLGGSYTRSHVMYIKSIRDRIYARIHAPMYAHAELLDGSCKVNLSRQTEGVENR